MPTFPAHGVGSWDTLLQAYVGTTITASGSDDTAALNAFLAAAPANGVSRLIGAFTISGSVTVPANVTVDATAASITTSLTSTSSVILGAGSTWRGGTITGPSSWDGTNTAAALVFAMIWVNGNNVTVDDLNLTNVYKVGIGIKDHDNVTVTDCHIVGNYPSGSWTGVETNHFGINSDPDAAGANLVVTGNIIESCVQGVFIGNFATGVGEGAAITGNLFEGCWNHGVYGYGYGMAVVGNSFHRCQIPVALDGQYHSITGNAIFTGTTGGSDQRDFTGISCRDSIGVSIVGNAIRGNAPTASNIISVTAVTGTVIRDIVVADNIVDVVGGTSCGISVGASATTCENISIHDNHVRTVGRANLGGITVAPSSTAVGVKIHDNTVVMLGNGHGVFVSNVDGAIVHDNQIRVEFDSGGAITIGMAALSTATNCQVHHNEFRVSASWGTNITLRAIYEVATVTNGRYGSNFYTLSPTKLAVATPLSLISGSNAMIDESLAGAPALLANPGSTYHRTDGGASTSLYVKETASTSTTWRAV